MVGDVIVVDSGGVALQSGKVDHSFVKLFCESSGPNRVFRICRDRDDAAECNKRKNKI